MKTINRIIIFFGLVAAISCEKKTSPINVIGSWYFKHDVWGYSEMYFSDSLFSNQNEMSGQTPNRRYYIKNDSIYFENDSNKFVAFFKLLELKGDTLWLGAKYPQKTNREFWIRFPKDEFGELDLKRTPETKDSLDYKAVVDYNRRMLKFQALEANDFKEYDSMVKAGYWKSDMREVREYKAEKIKRIEDRLKELESNN